MSGVTTVATTEEAGQLLEYYRRDVLGLLRAGLRPAHWRDSTAVAPMSGVATALTGNSREPRYAEGGGV